jgi:hypothetical protein
MRLWVRRRYLPLPLRLINGVDLVLKMMGDQGECESQKGKPDVFDGAKECSLPSLFLVLRFIFGKLVNVLPSKCRDFSTSNCVGRPNNGTLTVDRGFYSAPARSIFGDASVNRYQLKFVEAVSDMYGFSFWPLPNYLSKVFGAEDPALFECGLQKSFLASSQLINHRPS